MSISSNGLCGQGLGKYPNNKCCSKWGYCGNSDDYCNTGCQKDYRRYNDSKASGKCCSKYDYCGTTDANCGFGC